MFFKQIILSYSDAVVAAVIDKEKLDRKLVCDYCLKLLEIHHYASVAFKANCVLLLA